jgi:hypothetical protein
VPPPNTPDDGGTVNPGVAPHCVPLVNQAPRIEVEQIADDPSHAVGGTFKDGVYVQTWGVLYTGYQGDQGGISTTRSRETIEIMGNVGRYVFADDDHDDSTGGFRLTTSGIEITVAYECPAAPPKTFGLDVNGDDLALYEPGGVARFFTRQKGGTP